MDALRFATSKMEGKKHRGMCACKHFLHAFSRTGYVCGCPEFLDIGLGKEVEIDKSTNMDLCQFLGPVIRHVLVPHVVRASACL